MKWAKKDDTAVWAEVETKVKCDKCGEVWRRGGNASEYEMNKAIDDHIRNKHS